MQRVAPAANRDNLHLVDIACVVCIAGGLLLFWSSRSSSLLLVALGQSCRHHTPVAETAATSRVFNAGYPAVGDSNAATTFETSR